MAGAKRAQTRYPEKDLQMASVANLKTQHGYRELFDDVEATGARVDSVGVMDGRLWLIEYKVAVSGPMVRHSSGESGGLESKIAGTLGPLYRREIDNLSKLCNHVWDRSQPPIFAIIAKNFSDAAIEQIVFLYADRGHVWSFDLKVFTWDGRDHRLVLEVSPFAPFDPVQYERCQIDALVGSQFRNKNMTLSQACARAQERGFGCLFDAFVEAASRHGIKLNFQVNSVGGSLRGGNPPKILGCYFGESNPEDGLLIGLHRPAFTDAVEGIGLIGPDCGYLNFNRFLRTVDEVEALFAAILHSETTP